MTYFLISSVGENIQYQHGSSSGVSILLRNRLHFVKIQWHFELPIQILNSKLTVNILPPYRYSQGNLSLRSVQGHQCEYIPWLRGQNFRSLKQFYTNLHKGDGCFCISTSKKMHQIQETSPKKNLINL